MAERTAVASSSSAAADKVARGTQQTAQVRKVAARAHAEEKPFEDFQILPVRKPVERREPRAGERCSTGKMYE